MKNQNWLSHQLNKYDLINQNTIFRFPHRPPEPTGHDVPHTALDDHGAFPTVCQHGRSEFTLSFFLLYLWIYSLWLILIKEKSLLRVYCYSYFCIFINVKITLYDDYFVMLNTFLRFQPCQLFFPANELLTYFFTENIVDLLYVVCDIIINGFHPCFVVTCYSLVIH